MTQEAISIDNNPFTLFRFPRLCMNLCVWCSVLCNLIKCRFVHPPPQSGYRTIPYKKPSCYPFIALYSLPPPHIPLPSSLQPLFSSLFLQFCHFDKVCKWSHAAVFTQSSSHLCCLGFESGLMESMNVGSQRPCCSFQILFSRVTWTLWVSVVTCRKWASQSLFCRGERGKLFC